MIKKQINGIDCFLSDKLASIGAPHAFTTRRGGVSNGVFDSLNVSTRRKDVDGNTDSYESTVENFRRVTSLVGASPENSVCAHQVHGNTVLELDETFCGMGILRSAARNIDGDGLFVSSDKVGIGSICVKSADCTPILFADRRLGSVCAVHSGWRGTVLDIPGEAVRTMLRSGSCTEDIYCAVGPCIGVCCYEVSEDVYLASKEVLTARGAVSLLNEIFINERGTESGRKFDFDIGRMCAALVELAGIPKENIDLMNICTCCSSDRDGRIFFSHRGQKGYSGTFASVIAPFEGTHI